MDDNTRQHSAETFFLRLRLGYGKMIKDYFEKLGVQHVEDLKHLEDDNWKHITNNILKLNNIQTKQLKKAVDMLERTGDVNPFLVEPLPLKTANEQKCKSSPFQSGSPAGRKKLKAESMGGNLNKVASYFTSTRKSPSVEPIIIIDSDDGGVDGAISGLIEDNDWRKDRMDKDDMPNLKKLSDPAPGYEREQWRRECIIDSTLKPESDDFEDIYGYYAVLDKYLNRTSSSSDVENSYKARKADYRRQALLHHPDKNMNKTSEEIQSSNQMFQDTKDSFDKVREAYNCFTGITSEGCSGRMLYDQKCDLVIVSWKFKSGYDSCAAKELFKERNKAAKRKATQESKSTYTNFEKCATLFNTKGNQTIGWRIVVYHVMTKEEKTVADIARYIRIGRGVSGWDGTGESDKLYKAIYRKVAEAKKKIGDHGIDIHKLESMSAKNAAHVLKREYSSMTSTLRQNIGSIQNQMENQVMEYVRELRSKNQRVTRVIIFRKVIELFPMFKGGIHCSSFMSAIKSRLYMGFKKRKHLHYIRLSGASRKLPKGWEGMVAAIITRVGRRQLTRVVEGLHIPAIEDDSFANTDHIPVYRDMPGNYSWV